jgi:hypothetical protein
VGDAFYRGKLGQTTDYKKAYFWLLKAAEGGMGKAQNMVGVMHQSGKGVPLDRKEAEAWFRKSAAQGDINGQSNLGHLLYTQPGDRSAKLEAIKWLLVARQRGDVLATQTLRLVQADIPKAEMEEAQNLARGVKAPPAPEAP